METTTTNPTSEGRSTEFATNAGNRYWWHRRATCSYEPPVYASLDDDEWAILRDWFTESEAQFGPGTGECGVPCVSLLHGLIGGNGISRVAQLGHYLGYSTYLISLLLRRMGTGGHLYSVDIDQRATDFTQSWVNRFGTGDLVTLDVRDSADPMAVERARESFGGRAPQLVFIDSSHAYQHTLAELDRWYPALQDWGFLVLHDASSFAAAFDRSDDGGVTRAIQEWNLVARDRIFTINSAFEQGGNGDDLVYIDGCGLGLLQKLPGGDTARP
jgi:predicted O-methyltransferase YrrM